MPEGRGNTTPVLNLGYSNQSATDNDIFGYGWRLSIPYIETLNKIGVEKMYSASTAYFFSSLSGELVQIGTTTSYRAKVETGDFLQYASSSSGWIVTDKSGIKYYFGTASTSRQDSVTDSSKVARWMLSKVEDTNGNFATYTYTKDQGTIYPAKVVYTNSSSTTGIFEVRFNLSTTTQAVTSYDKAFSIKRQYHVAGVEVYVNNTKVRNYNLRYGNGLNGKRDLLLGVTESGFEGASTTTLPEVTFGYEGVQQPSWTSGQFANNFPEPISEKDLGVRFGDLNGDGLTDVVRYYQYTDSGVSDIRVKRVHINKGNGNWDYNVAWNWDDIAVPFQLTEKGLTDTVFMYNDMGTRLIDVNGDGRDDVVVAYKGPTTYSGYPTAMPLQQIAVYLNTGSGFKKDTSWTGLVEFSEWNTSQTLVSNMSNAFVDVNGDGLPDIVGAVFNSYSNGSPQANTISSVLINNGNGWTYDSSLTFPAAFGKKSGTGGYRSFDDVGTRLADVNGDGLIDVLRGYKDGSGTNVQMDETKVYINKVNGWDSTSWSLPENFTSIGNSTGVNIVDVNGDKLPDLIRANDNGSSDTYNYYLNTGNGWASQSYNLPFFLTKNATFQNSGVALVDFNGDTLVDGWNMSYTDLLGTHATGGSVIINNAPIPDQLASVLLPNGGAINVTLDGYLSTRASDYGNVGTSTFNPVVVSKYSYSSGFGNEWSNDYDYAKADFSYSSTSLRDRKFAGFGKVIRTDSLAKTTTYYHQGNGNATTSEEANDNFSKIGFAYRSDTADLSGNLYQALVNKYSTTTLGNGANFVKLDRETRLDYDGDSDHRDIANEYSYNTSKGDVTQKTEWGRVTASLDGTFTDVTGDKKTTNYVYSASSTNSALSLPARETVKNESNATTSDVRYLYDSQALGSFTKGNLTKREHWVATSTYIDYEWAYNAFGLLTQEKDPLDKATNYTYDTYNLYPATTTNPLSQATKYTYDYSSGKPKTVTDVNNLTNTIVYDGLDRPIEEKIPDPSSGSTITKTTYTYNDAIGTSSVLTKDYLSATTTKDTYSYLDGFGREIQRRTNAETSNQYVTKDFVYGDNGMMKAESLPYFSTSSAKTVATYVSPLYSNYIYDAEGRIKYVRNSVGTTSTSYDQWEESVFDALGKEKDFTYDAFGNLIKVSEHNGTSTYYTNYEWDTSGNLTKITDALSNVRNIAYDALSRRTSLEDLHASPDTSFGTWSFAYDNSGNLISKTDPKSQVVNYTYDDINRPLTENYTGQAGTEITYTYDSCTRGVGRLCTAKNTSATTTYTYNYVGSPATEAKNIATTTYTTGYTYDRQGNQTLITYPDNSEVKYTFNTANLLEKVEQKENGGSWRNVINNFDYAPTGQITYQEHSNGTKTTKSYDPFELYRLRSIVTTASSTYGTGGAGSELTQAEENLFMAGLLTEEVSTTTPDLGLTAVPDLATTTEALLIDETVTESGVATTTEEIISTTTPTIEITDANISSEIATTSTSTEVVEIATSTPTSTDVIEIATSTPTSTESEISSTTPESILPIEIATISTTTDFATTTPELKPIDTTVTDMLITNAHEARMWKKYHDERLKALENDPEAPKETLESARYAKDKFDNYLLQKGYTETKGSEVKSKAQEFIKDKLKKGLEAVLSFILPEKALAYLFGKEDFESCGSLPCSFNNTSTWGSVTASLDSTSKVAGADSLKEVVAGEGSGALESINHNKDEVWVQFKVFVPSSMTWGASGYFSALRFEDSSNGGIFWMNVENWGTPRLTMMGDTLSWTNTGLDLVAGQVNTIELRFKKGTTNGDVDIWLNNSVQNSPNYNSSGTLNTGTDNVDDILVGVTYSPETGVATTYYDDISIDTAFIGVPSSAPVEPFDAVLQDSTYIYDAVGNITHIVDKSNASSTVTYGYEYDDLYRLTKFGTTTATLNLVGKNFGTTLRFQPGSEGKDTFYSNVSTQGGLPDADVMYVGGYNGDIYESFIEFNPGDLSQFSAVSLAKLKMFVNLDTYSANSAKLKRVTQSWTESGVTYANNPTSSDIGMSWQPATKNDWWVADVTSTADSWVKGTNPNYGFKIVAENNTNAHTITFRPSDFSTPSLRPILEVTGSIPYNVYQVSTSTITPIETFTYDALGNILTKSDLGPYTYDGNVSNTTSYSIYNDAITSGWVDWSWSTTLNPSNTTPVESGSYSLRSAYTAPWGGLSYHTNSFNTTPYNNLELSLNVGTATTTQYYLYFLNQANTVLTTINLDDYITGTYSQNTWHHLTIPLSALGLTAYNNALTFNLEASASSTIYLDNIKFTGTTGTPNYANPHAPTSINGVSYLYDTNGNLITQGNTTHSYTYNNYLNTSHNTATTTYTYDHQGQRVQKTTNTTNTIYPNNLYETQGTTTTKHIYANGNLVATIKSDTPAPKLYHNHLDHLGSTQAVTTPDGYLDQEIQYYPFGETKLDNQYGSLTQSNQYIGQNFDQETELSYLNARYYDGTRGQMLTQDPVFLGAGVDNKFTMILKDPQLQNSYGYARNNPLIYKDPNGELAFLAMPVIAVTLTAFEYFGYSMAAVGVYNLTNVLRYPEGYSSAEIDSAGNRVLKDIASGGVGRLAGRTIESGMNTFDAVYDTSIYVKEKVRNKVNSIMNSPVQSSPNIYQSTPSSKNNPANLDTKTRTQTISSGSNRSSSKNSSSNLSTATSYYNKAQDAYSRGDYKTAKKYAEKAQKTINK